MDAELKAKWLEALRSGRYDQTTGQLRDGNCFCCLGVLCDVFDPEAWDIGGIGDVPEWSYGEGHDQRSEVAVLPQNFRITYGISPAVQDHVVQMNDAGKTFSEIANYIEAKL